MKETNPEILRRAIVNAVVIARECGDYYKSLVSSWEQIAEAATELSRIEQREGFDWENSGVDFETVCAEIGTILTSTATADKIAPALIVQSVAREFHLI